MTEELDKLIAVVEASDTQWVRSLGGIIASLVKDIGPHHNITKAFNGSVDASKALHETLLPNWNVSTMTHSLEGGWHCRLTCVRGNGWTQYLSCVAFDEDMARAWLLAVLRAYREQVKAK